jgi:hypothetical protein
MLCVVFSYFGLVNTLNSINLCVTNADFKIFNWPE